MSQRLRKEPKTRDQLINEIAKLDPRRKRSNLKRLSTAILVGILRVVRGYRANR